MIKKLILLFLLLGIINEGISQQIGLFSQYIHNDYLINPAIVGTKKFIPIHLSIRRQWVGITEAPVSQQLSSHGYTDQNFGIGGAIFNEASGPTRRTGLNFSTAYHLVVDRKKSQDQVTLSFGLQGSLTQHILDKEQLTTFVPNDPTIEASYNYQMLPDFGLGFYFHKTDRFAFGVSALNLVQTKKDLYNLNNPVSNQLVRNYFLMGKMYFDLDEDEKFSFEPSFLVRMIEATPMQFDINAKLHYNKKFWIGTSYRHKDAIVALLGVRIYQMLVGYSYDITMSDLKNYNSGTHELALTFLINGGYKVREGKSPEKFRPNSKSF